MISFGGYSAIGFGSPPEVFERVVDDVLKPILTMLYHRVDACFSLSLSGAEIEWLESNHPEVNMLIRDLVKKDRLEIVGSTYYQGIPSLLSPRERSGQIEKMTTSIRLNYGSRSGSFFCYGQVFSPNIVTTLSMCGIVRLLISPSEGSPREPFIMNELDKSIIILPIDDDVSRLVHEYGTGKYPFSQLMKNLTLLFNDGKERVVFLNLDRLACGPITGEEVTTLATLCFDRGTVMTNSFDTTRTRGYQHDGWFGRDSDHLGMDCFNAVFLKDRTLGSIYGRYLTLCDFARTYKKNKDVKKQLEKLVLKCGMGSIYLQDANASMLRTQSRHLFFRAMIEAQLLLSSEKDFSFPTPYDWDRDGEEEYYHAGRNMLALLTPRGGAISELLFIPSLTNYAAAFVPVGTRLHGCEGGTPLRLFSDIFSRTDGIRGSYQNFSSSFYEIDDESAKKGEYVARLEGPISLTKRFTFRANTILVEVTMKNNGGGKLNGFYGSFVPLSLPQTLKTPLCNITDDYSRKSKYVTESHISIGHVRSARVNTNVTITLFCSQPFTLVKEDENVIAETPLGREKLDLHLLLVPLLPVFLEAKGEVTFTIGLRIEKKQN